MSKVVLITGASRGIGASTAIEFAKNSYNIVINYNYSEKDALDLKKNLENKYHIECLLIKADISKEEDIKYMINKVISGFGHIDVIVNNASIAIDTLVSDKTKEMFNKVLDTNLVGTFLVCKYAMKHMKENTKGAIINISSTNGIDTNYPFSIDYDASKAGVISLTKNLAIELAPNIRVNTVAPGWVNTDMNKNLDEDFKKKEIDKILLKRFAEPQEIAKVIFFLATDNASYINGSVIRVDGGSN